MLGQSGHASRNAVLESLERVGDVVLWLLSLGCDTGEKPSVSVSEDVARRAPGLAFALEADVLTGIFSFIKVESGISPGAVLLSYVIGDVGSEKSRKSPTQGSGGKSEKPYE
jgi:hypothetical protein